MTRPLAALLLAFAVPVACKSGPPRQAPAQSASPDSPAPAPAPAPPTPTPTPTPSPPPPSPSSQKPCHVALIGDSLTDFRVHGGGYVRYLEARCPGSRFENFAKGGAMVNQMRRQLEETALSTPRDTYSHVVVFGGVNDIYSDETAGRTNDKIERDLTAMYAAIRAHGARVVAVTVAPWGGFTRYFTPHRAESTRKLGRFILEQRERGTIDVAVDAYALLSCGDPERICERYDRARSDGLHFGKVGHEVLGQALYEAEFKNCR